MIVKITNILVMVVSYVLLILSTVYGFNLAKKTHNVTLKDVKNEIPNGFLVRGICSAVYYFSIFDWIFGWKLVPYSYVPYSFLINAAGILLLLFTVGFFWIIHIHLGSNFHGPMKIHDTHKLVKTGPYKYIRHPTYLAFPLLHVSYFLITGNILLLISGLIMAYFVNSKRIKVEEELLKTKFGKEYEDYMQNTGRYFFKLFRR